jgi:hypothetical protein
MTGLSSKVDGNLGNAARIVLFLLMAAMYLGVPNTRPDFTRFNANDSESYIALGWNLARGHGYTRSMVDGLYEPHKTWPPGVPALMIPAALLSGPTINWYAVKWTMCVTGLLGVALAWLYLTAVTGRKLIGDVGALALGLSPLYWDFSHQAMAEVPLTAACILTLFLVHRAWMSSNVQPSRVIIAGLVGGVAMMFKGHGGGLLLAPLAYLYGRQPKTRLPGRTGWRAYALFVMAFSLFPVAWTARNAQVLASGFDNINQFRSVLAADPNDSESPVVGLKDLSARAMRNFRDYAIYRPAQQLVPGLWAERALSWTNSGWLALLISSTLFALALRARSVLVAPVLVAGAMVLLNFTHAFGGAARYWIPVNSLMLLCLCVTLAPALESRARLLRAVVVVLFLNLSLYMWQHERQPYNENGPWRQLAELAEAVAQEKGLPRVNVYTQNPEAFALVTGLPAPSNRRPELTYGYVVLNSQSQVVPETARTIVTRSPLVFAALPTEWSLPQILEATRQHTSSQ